MGNSIAYASIIFWPIIVFFILSYVGIIKGTILSVFLSYLFLPASFEIDLPGIPALDKGSITSLAIFLYVVFKGKKLGIKDLQLKEKTILIVLILAPFLTAIYNAESYLHLPGVSLYDGLSLSINNLLIFMPFMFGYKFFRDKDSHELYFRFFVIMLLFYSILILYEIRMSPQLHTMLYGYFPHSFIQQYRSGGFRAVVFVGHGLLVAMLVSVAFMISTTLWRAKIKAINKYNINGLIVAFLFIVLILSKSYGALILGIMGFLLIRFFSSKHIFIVSFLLVSTYALYPLMSASKIFPHNQVVELVSKVNADRAQSLEFRFFHENQLLEHANKKPWFGWGSWGRNRVYDSETFKDLSVTDGRWIIVLGTKGWLGFMTEFFFVAFSILKASKAVSILKKRKDKDKSIDKEVLLISSHALIVSLVLIDQIPNSSFNYFYWLLVGVLYGRSYQIIKSNENSIKN